MWCSWEKQDNMKEKQEGTSVRENMQFSVGGSCKGLQKKTLDWQDKRMTTN